MEMEIIEERDNPLLKRKELKICIKHEGKPTPKKEEVYKEIASRYSVPEENIIIDYIFTKKGVAESIVKAKIYEHKVREKKVEEKKEEGEVKDETQASKEE